MIVNGIDVSPASEQTLEAWIRSHTGQAGFRASDLVAQVRALGIPSLNDETVTMRFADRLLQKHKKLRNIRLCGANNWCWVKAI